jgi:hypothetical protein
MAHSRQPRCTSTDDRAPAQNAATTHPVAKPAQREHPRSHIHRTHSGFEDLAQAAAAARSQGWQYYELATDHMPMLSTPGELVAVLFRVAEDKI